MERPEHISTALSGPCWPFVIQPPLLYIHLEVDVCGLE